MGNSNADDRLYIAECRARVDDRLPKMAWTPHPYVGWVSATQSRLVSPHNHRHTAMPSAERFSSTVR
jgi:hypothetical protein